MSHSLLSSNRWLRTAVLLLWGVGLLAHPGCVRRRLTVRSNPPGALVYVDDQEVGVTPAATPFVYYGTRKIQILADGYEPLTVKQPLPAPWYQIPPLDFFVENLWPWELRDERVVQFDLQPLQVVPNEKLIERAEALRGNAQAGIATPLPVTAAGTP
jgi:hypothetical protein